LSHHSKKTILSNRKLEEKYIMYQKRLMILIGLLAAFSMILSACGPTATATTAPPATQGAAATEAPTQVPPTTRHGGWLDEIDFSVVDSASAITQLKAGAIDVYAGGLASADFPAIKDAGLSYSDSNGLYYDIMYNPAVLKDANVLNPFSDRKIREATNWLYDRNYINQEVYAGGGLAKWFTIQTNGPDYADLADVARGLESEYAYNPDKAKQQISDEMTTLGATLGADGKWQYKGSPVTVIFLVRSDSDGTRKPIGDYVTKQLESVGFTVDEQYKKSSEASPLVFDSDPVDGKWTLYTAAWSSSVISRDDAGMFQQMYLNTSIQGAQPFLSNVADPAFQKLGDDLYNSAFKDMTERHSLMAEAMKLSLQDSLQVFLIDGKNYAPYVNTVQVTGDLAAGIEGAQIYPQTVRFIGKEGGTLKWGEPDMFGDPWNPVGGSNWTFDHAAYGPTEGGAFISDPFTGLVWPLFADKAEITAQTGLPIHKSLDWVTLNTADTITVPTDAFIDWDVKAQKFITVGEKDPNGLTAKIKSVVTYRPDLFDAVKWHDGSNFSVADILMPMIMSFDEANPDSPIYDESLVPTFQQFQATFKGFKIASTSPLTIEYYTDLYQQDAELNAVPMWPGNWGFNVSYQTGEAPWDVMAIGNLADAAGELAWSADKADAKKIEETSLIGGPSLDILSKHLDEAESQSLIPYAPTLGQYITAEQAKARYDNLKKWYTDHSTFWVGTGPYYLDKVFTTEKTLTLKTNPNYPDLSDRWNRFGAPKLADASIDGPAQVKIGDTATFDINVTFQGEPYAQSDVKAVKYLLYDATGAVVGTGDATAVADGHWQVVLGADVTSKLTAGSDKIEVAVLPIPVITPTFTSLDFVTVP
jgi:peptide/nickel transport system substrate-binding protein